jgi:hypothetical protein
MNLTFIVDPNHSYRQAIKIAYEKALREGGVDELTALQCEMVLSEPEPDYVYHEVSLDTAPRFTADGGMCFRTLSPCEAYEQIKLDGQRGCAEYLAGAMRELFEEFKAELNNLNFNNGKKELAFSVDEEGTLRLCPLFDSSGLCAEGLFASWISRNRQFQSLANQYASVVMSIAGRTLGGKNSEYAKYFRRREE